MSGTVHKPTFHGHAVSRDLYSLSLGRK